MKILDVVLTRTAFSLPFMYWEVEAVEQGVCGCRLVPPPYLPTCPPICPTSSRHVYMLPRQLIVPSWLVFLSVDLGLVCVCLCVCFRH